MPGRSGPGGEGFGGQTGGGGGGGGCGPGCGPGGGGGPGGVGGPGGAGAGAGGFHGANTMEVKLENAAGHLVVGQLGPVSVEQFLQRFAKSHSLYHPQLDSKGLPRTIPQLT